MAQERLRPTARRASRPRFAPDLAVEILSPGDRASVLARKIALYLAHGARVVLVVRAEQRRVDVHRASVASVEERLAHGAWPLAPFDGLVLDWDAIYEGIDLSRW